MVKHSPKILGNEEKHITTTQTGYRQRRLHTRLRRHLLPRLDTGRDAYIQDCYVTFYPDWVQAETLTYKTATSPSTQSRDSPRRDSTVFLQDVSRLERRKALSQ